MLSVASCSSSQSLRKRKNDDHDSSEIKVRRGDVYIVLESESEVSSSEEGTESILSLQNKSTDFAKDTSDTSTKSSHQGSDLEGIEYEVVSLSEKEALFNSCSSGTDSEHAEWRESIQSAGEADSGSMWADSSSTESDLDRQLISLRMRNCIKCKAQPTRFQYCDRCYKLKKDFFPSRPKKNFRKKKSVHVHKKKSNISEEERAQAVSLWVESSCSQEVSLTSDSQTNGYEGPGLCSVCFKSPKNGAFLHNRWVHIYACYQCSLKIWFSTRCCPLCNRKIRQVFKVAIG